MSELQSTISVTPEQIQFFHDNGFLAIDAITTPEEIEMMRGAYDRIFAARAGREEGNQFDLGGSDEDDKPASLPQILNPSKYAPELRDTLYQVNAQAIARQLMGSEAAYQGNHAILKPAHHGAPTPWHQDEAYWSPDFNYTKLSVWMPLQAATRENGCLQFVPGSHRLEVLPHHSIGHDPRVHGLEADDPVDPNRAVACPLPAGGATFHHNRTLHYAGPNNSDIPRRAYVLGFGLPPRPAVTSRRFIWNEQKIAPRQARAEAAAAQQK